MELRRYIAMFWRRLWVIVLSAVLATGAMYVYSVTSKPVYQATATLEINYGSDPRSDAVSALTAGVRSATTYVQQIRSPQVAREVIAALGLNMSPSTVLGMISATQIRDTQLIRVSAEAGQPELAQAIANRIAEVFIAQTTAKQQARFQSAQQELDTQISLLEKQMADEQKAIAALGDPRDSRNQSIPEFARVELTRLQSALNRDQTVYTVLLKSREDFRLAATRYVDTLTISSPAELPGLPIRPRTAQNVLIGLIAGVLLGVSLAFVLEYLDDTIKTSDDIRRISGLTSLGAIMRMPASNGATAKHVHEVDSRSPLSEAYRILRTNIDFARLDHPGQTLLVTSPNPGEGKTTTVSNLAIVMAESGRRVIAIDSDLRRPTLHRHFGLSNATGMTNLLLAEEPNLSAVLQPTSVPNLRVIASGPIPPNPSELLASGRMSRLLDRLRSEADLILLDSPPVLAVADSTVLGARVDGVVLVIDAGATRAEALARATETLTRGSARMLGVVLNKLTSRVGGYYYYYYHHYYSSDDHTANGNGNGHHGAGPGKGDRPAGLLETVSRAIRLK